MSIKRYSAEMEYKRNPKLCKEAVQRVLEWAHERAFLPKTIEEDAILFLTSCKYDEELAKKTLEIYHTFKSETPNLFYHIDPLADNFCPEKSSWCYYVLPGETKDGCKVMYAKVNDACDTSQYRFERELKFCLCQIDLMTYEAGAIPGWHIVYDMDNTSLYILTMTQPALMKKVLYYCQEACPIELRSIHIVNPTGYVKLAMALIKPFLKASVAKNLHVHNNIEELYEYCPRKYLPRNIGGYFEPANVLRTHALNRLLANRDVLLNTRVEPKNSNESKGKGIMGRFWS